MSASRCRRCCTSQSARQGSGADGGGVLAPGALADEDLAALLRWHQLYGSPLAYPADVAQVGRRTDGWMGGSNCYSPTQPGHLGYHQHVPHPLAALLSSLWLFYFVERRPGSPSSGLHHPYILSYYSAGLNSFACHSTSQTSSAPVSRSARPRGLRFSLNNPPPSSAVF